MHLLCKCGCDMWNGQTPNDIEYRVFSDRRMDKILEKDEISTIEMFGLNDYDVWRCPACRRLYVFKNESGGAGNKVLCVYKPDDDSTII